jgi:predicted RNA-binding protein YlxR (DUF448 family)
METGDNMADVIKGTSRKCIASGEVKDKSSLLRFVVTPDNMIVADVLEKLPGKGIWLGCSKDLLEKTLRDGLLARVTKKPITVPETLLDDVEQMLTNRVISLISLARKSGRAVAGYEKVKDWLSKDLATVLVQSQDGSERGKSKLSTPRGGTFIDWLKSSELGLAFGRQTVIHCALASGGITQRVVHDALRLKGLRPSEGDLRIVKKEKTTI